MKNLVTTCYPKIFINPLPLIIKLQFLIEPIFWCLDNLNRQELDQHKCLQKKHSKCGLSINKLVVINIVLQFFNNIKNIHQIKINT